MTASFIISETFHRNIPRKARILDLDQFSAFYSPSSILSFSHLHSYTSPHLRYLLDYIIPCRPFFTLRIRSKAESSDQIFSLTCKKFPGGLFRTRTWTLIGEEKTKRKQDCKNKSDGEVFTTVSLAHGGAKKSDEDYY